MLNLSRVCFFFYCGAMLLAPAIAVAEAPANRVPDASFESPVGSWLSESRNASYCAEREEVANASDGKTVLVLSGWEKGGSRVLSPVFALDAEVWSASVDVRGVSPAPGTTVELAMFDEAGATLLGSFGSIPLVSQDKWTTLSSLGVKLNSHPAKGRLAIVVSGPQKGARLEIDRLGLFAGGMLGDITDNSSFTWFEAEALADGKAWKSVDHYAGWYSDLPSGMKMLGGAQAVADADNHPATKTLRVHAPGMYRLWARVMHTNSSDAGAFNVAIRQAGNVVAAREVNSNDATLGPDFSWAWASLDARLIAGDVEISLSRPSGEASWITRKIDLIALTNLLDYHPDIQDFRPTGYLRFTNLTQGQDPFCIYTFVHRLQPPLWYVNPGILSAAGFSGGYYVTPDHDRWLASGESSPWVRISDTLVPAGNLVEFIATRTCHTEGFVRGHVRGRLEFAVGRQRRVVKTIDIDQDAPRLLTKLPADFQNKAPDILTASDFVKQSEQELQKLAPTPGPVARHLTLTGILGLNSDIDDPRIVDREIGILERLGFNGSYTIVPPAKDAVDFYSHHGLGRHYGVDEQTIQMVKEGCPSQPDLPAMDAAMARAAARTAPVTDRFTRVNVGDEPGAAPYSHFVSCPECRRQFVQWLRSDGKMLADLGVRTWEQVVPVLPEQRAQLPALYYYTSLFRLKTFADCSKAAVAAVRKHFPPGALAHVNYSPPANWVASGTDLFYTQRTGGFEMGWTEDWLGYGAGPEQSSESYALLRAAGGPGEALGGYCVGVSGTPLHMRIKLYELLAGGARHIDLYAYGPEYATVDTWSRRYEIYPAISKTLHEFGAIDEALNGTTRHKTDIAILYSRTASIWAAEGSTPQQDSYFTRWALCHAGYDADFIPEEDVVAGKLAGYKVLYLAGPQLRRDAATTIAEWVRGGGVLFGAAGAGSRDELDRPLTTLNGVFGAECRNLKLEHDVGRPKFELRNQPILGELSSVDGSGAPLVRFNQICFGEDLKPEAGAIVILKRKDGAACGVMNSCGRGRAIRVAASPGLAYINDAVRGSDYDPDSYLPRRYHADLRDFLTWPARLANAQPIASLSAPLAEIVRYDASNRSVVFVIDHQAEPRELTLTLPAAAQFTRARSASGKPVSLKAVGDHALQVTLQMDVVDAVVLEE